MRRVKLELRRGILFGPRLQKLACNPFGLYCYLLIRKPFGLDRLVINGRLVAADFGIDRHTLRCWFDLLRDEERLTWDHRRPRGLCVHIEKAGDHTGDQWVPSRATHGEFRDGRKTRHQVMARKPAITDPVMAEKHAIMMARKPAITGPSSTKPQESSYPQESSPGAAAPRVPDGPRVGAQTYGPPPEDLSWPWDERAELHRKEVP